MSEGTKMYTTEGWTMYDGTEGFKEGDKVEFMLSPDHCWQPLIPMAVAVIAEIHGNSFSVQSLEHGIMVVIAPDRDWGALVRKVPDETPVTFDQVAIYIDDGDSDALIKLHESCLGVLAKVSEDFEQQALILMMSQVRDSIDDSIVDSDLKEVLLMLMEAMSGEEKTPTLH